MAVFIIIFIEIDQMAQWFGENWVALDCVIALAFRHQPSVYTDSRVFKLFLY